MANTRSGVSSRDGAAGSSVSPSISTTARMETRSSSATATTTNLRRSTRETKGKKKPDLATTSTTPPQRSTRATRDSPVSSTKKPQGDSSPSMRKSSRVKATSVSPPSASKQDSNASMSTDNTATKRKNDRQKDNHIDPQSAGSMSKKQKRLNTKSYIALFKAKQEQAKSPPVLASPHRGDEENASKVQVEDNGADLVYIQSDAQQVNQEPASVVANKVVEGHSSDLHETCEAISEKDELKNGCPQSEVISESHMPVEICSLNKEAEGIPMMEAGEQTDGHSNQKSLPELQNGPCSIAHGKEASKHIEGGDLIGIQGACTSTHIEAVQCDETDRNDQMCAGCKSTSISDILKSSFGMCVPRNMALHHMYKKENPVWRIFSQ